MSSQRILNILLAVCLAAGFACFALFVLPDQIRRARAMPPPDRAASVPDKLSSIISFDSPSPAPLPDGMTARFTPEGEPPSPLGVAPLPADQRMVDARNDIVAGGAGAAIDDTSGEARQAIASEAGLPGEFKAFPPSSLARRDPSALDGDSAKLKKSWIATPAGLEEDVAFWRDVYTKYDRNHVVLHHPRHLSIVYDVVDVSDIANDVRLTDVERDHMREKRIDERRDRITAQLETLATNPPSSSLSDEELGVKKLFRGVQEENAFKKAAGEDGVRAQTGQRDKFIPGLAYSGRYLGEIEAIFESYGLPRELTRIIFVESMFNPRAISSVGASGIFQFMRGTGKLYLEINDIVDERNDPTTAAHAAARLLRHDFDELGAWPLAVNAYNTGRGRMQQAVAGMGTTDIGKIVRGFDHPAYGFASRNFFLEFLAALDVAEHAEKYFGELTYDKPLRYEIVRSGYSISLPEVARIAGINLDEIMELNPAFTPKIASGLLLVPTGFSIRVPEKKSELFLAAATRAPKSRSGPVKHVVNGDDTLDSLARMYGVTQQAIIKSSNLVSRRLHPGQTLLVPVDEK
ncbi:MAG: transglycosylase SLT domain-containing protein [Pseudomonadota bacterium]